ncbi:hypothetical protein DFH11DRAFT_1582701 [Phellopilus nigrolimitatus]|nr:hypothetical protein DFH11DRAFT_1582701 [Phellopilus nigrolimitatus]
MFEHFPIHHLQSDSRESVSVAFSTPVGAFTPPMYIPRTRLQLQPSSRLLRAQSRVSRKESCSFSHIRRIQIGEARVPMSSFVSPCFCIPLNCGLRQICLRTNLTAYCKPIRATHLSSKIHICRWHLKSRKALLHGLCSPAGLFSDSCCPHVQACVVTCPRYDGGT